MDTLFLECDAMVISRSHKSLPFKQLDENTQSQVVTVTEIITTRQTVKTFMSRLAFVAALRCGNRLQSDSRHLASTRKGTAGGAGSYSFLKIVNVPMTILRCMTHMQCDYKGVGGLGRFVRA